MTRRIQTVEDYEKLIGARDVERIMKKVHALKVR